MARTTFSGPVRSLNGFVSAGPGAAQTINADNTTLALSIFPAPTVDSNANMRTNFHGSEYMRAQLF